MKYTPGNVIILLLSFVLILSALTSCGGDEKTAPAVIVRTEKLTDKSGDSASYMDFPVIEIVGDEALTGEINALPEIAGMKSVFETHTSNLNDAYEQTDTFEPHYACTYSITDVSVCGNVLSIEYMENEYMGGVHGSIFPRTLNISLENGKTLTLHDILNTDADEEVMRGLFADKLRNEYGMENADDMVDEALKSTDGFGRLLFRNDGICLAFTPYEVSISFSEGFGYAVVPYSEAAGYVKPEYIPVTTNETIDGSVTPRSGISDSSVIPGAVIPVNAHVEGTVFNLKIGSGENYVRETKFFASRLESNCDVFTDSTWLKAYEDTISADYDTLSDGTYEPHHLILYEE